MQTSAYVHSDAYFTTIDQLEQIARTFDPTAPDDLRTRIIEVLGHLGVWPDSCSTGIIRLELLEKAA